MISAAVLLFAVFLFGLGVGYRLTILVLHSFIKDDDRNTQLKKLKDLTGYRHE
jgi:hypothetical protein